jgi:hypothetical protein
MPSVTVLRTGVTNPGAPVMAVHQENGPVVSLISSPPTPRGSAAVWSLSEQTRPGLHPLLIRSAPGLRSVSFDHWVRHRNPYESVEAEITALRAVAESGARVRFTGGGLIPGDTWWRVEAFDIEAEETGRNGVISRAKLAWSLKQATTIPPIKLTLTGATPGNPTGMPPATTSPPSTGYTGGIVRPDRGNITE